MRVLLPWAVRPSPSTLNPHPSTLECIEPRSSGAHTRVTLHTRGEPALHACAAIVLATADRADTGDQLARIHVCCGSRESIVFKCRRQNTTWTRRPSLRLLACCSQSWLLAPTASTCYSLQPACPSLAAAPRAQESKARERAHLVHALDEIVDIVGLLARAMVAFEACLRGVELEGQQQLVGILHARIVSGVGVAGGGSMSEVGMSDGM